MTRAASLLAGVLRAPEQAAHLSVKDWTEVITVARAEQLVGSLAIRLAGQKVPEAVRRRLNDARIALAHAQTQARWEVEMTQRAFHSAGYPVVLLKGCAYIIAGLEAGDGRFVGDLDILLPRRQLDDAERRLLAAGWEWVKADAYDDHYYRQWMHELPPLIHRARDRMIDVHHTILPLTHRLEPDAEAMIRDCVRRDDGISFLNPADMICHAVAHMLADGDLAGSLRNLWDIYQLLREFRHEDPDFDKELLSRAARHGLTAYILQADRLAAHLFGDGRPLGWRDRWFLRCILARDGWGKKTYPITRCAFYLRAHMLRMPPLMLARHLFTKWRKG